MATVQTNIRMERYLLECIRREAEAREMTVAEFVRQALMFRLGFLAVTEGAPALEVEAILRRLMPGAEEGATEGDRDA